MLLKVENQPVVRVGSFGQVAEALIHLTYNGDSFLVLESKGEGFVQVRRRGRHYIVEWRQDLDSSNSKHGLARAGRKGSLGKVVHTTNDGIFKTYASEQLQLGEAFEILTAFFFIQVRPARFRWRGLKKLLQRYLDLKKND